ncbi:MAG: PQQ-binding-like beta-propeller repeat protein [Methanoregula sp.]
MMSLVSAPLIGPWLYRRSVKELADRARQGNEEAVRNLAGIFCTPRVGVERYIARTALCSLVSQPAIDTLCKEALERDDKALYSITVENNYLPCDPGTQALFLFVTSQRERYAHLDYSPHRPLLAAGYAQATNRVRFHTLNAAHKTGQCSILAAALRGLDQNGITTPWSDKEWEIVITGLIQERLWENLWLLVIHSPLDLAITAMTAMNAAGWKPAGDERALWEEITGMIPGEWTSPVPDFASAPMSLSPDCQPLHLAFSENGTLLAAGCTDGTICLWNTRTGTLEFRIHSGQGSISGLAVSPGNTHLLTAGTNRTLECRDTITGNLLWSVESGEQAPVQFACSCDGIVLVPDSAGGHLRIVNLADGQIQTLSGGHEGSVTSCALSRDDRLFAVGYADGTVGCWDLQKTHYLRTLEGLGDPVTRLTFCEGDEDILVLYEQNRPTRWRITSGERLRTYTGNTGPLRCCAIMPDTSSFAIAGEDRMLRFWQGEKAVPVAEIPLYNRPLTACAASADGRMLATGCTDGTLRMYTMNGGTILHEKKAHKQAMTAITLSSSTEWVASAGWDGTVKLWNSTSGELVRTLLQPAGGVTGITATPYGSKVYAGYADGTVRQVPCGTGDFNRTLDMYTNTVRAIAISPDGTLLACAGGDTTLRVWNSETGGLVTGIEGLTTSQHCLAFSPDGKTLISGGWDGKVRLWNVTDGTLQKTLIGHTSTITVLAISPDSTMLATGSNDRSVRLWTIEGGQCVLVREDSRSEVSALALSPDRTLLAFAGADAIIHFCYMPEGSPAPSIPALPGKITALAFAGDGRVLVAGLDTGTVAVYSVAGRHLLRTVTVHTAGVTGIVVLPGGDSVLTSGLDGLVRHMNLPWTRPMYGTTLEDIPLVARYARTSPRPDAQAQWAFLHGMLTARFRNDIELCTTVNDESMYDIQIVG